MAKLRANIGLTSPETEQYKRDLDAKWMEFFSTQFHRVADPIQRIMDTALGKSGHPVVDEFSQKLSEGIRTVSQGGYNPLDLLEATSEGVGFGAPGGTTATSAVGQIRGLPPRAAKAVRKAMQQEAKLRGTPQPVGQEQELVSNLLRGTFFHGRGTYPETRYSGTTGEVGFKQYGEPIPRPDFRKSRKKGVNLGEPTGISLTSKMEVAEKFGTEYNFGRVMPLFQGPPESQVITAWTPKGGKILKETYEKTIQKIFRENPELARKLPPGERTYENFKYQMGSTVERGKFNKLFTEELKSKGFKGILYSPERYGEYELKMFDPKDVLMVDRRTKFDPAGGAVRTPKELRRLGSFGKDRQLYEFGKLPGMVEKGHLYNWYRELDMPKVLDEVLDEVTGVEMVLGETEGTKFLKGTAAGKIEGKPGGAPDEFDKLLSDYEAVSPKPKGKPGEVYKQYQEGLITQKEFVTKAGNDIIKEWETKATKYGETEADMMIWEDYGPTIFSILNKHKEVLK